MITDFIDKIFCGDSLALTKNEIERQDFVDKDKDIPKVYEQVVQVI
ncbi:MAG: hypothetical protein IKI67_03465 [Bacteroidales bacterium]|nr:hypothetical protein [Bacteroidales bacterium]